MDNTRYDIENFETIITGIWIPSSLLSAKFVRLVDTSVLFKISNIFFNLGKL